MNELHILDTFFITMIRFFYHFNISLYKLLFININVFYDFKVCFCMNKYNLFVCYIILNDTKKT